MRLIILMLFVLFTTGCTSVISSGIDGDVKTDTSTNNSLQPEIGLLTTRYIAGISQIAKIPVNEEHVVWYSSPALAIGNAVKSDSDNKSKLDSSLVKNIQPEKRSAVVIDVEAWPLLESEDDLNSIIGSISMCDCKAGECDLGVQPCTDPERYLCKSTKALSYCVEVK